MDRGAWWVAVHGVETSWRQLFSLFSFHLKVKSERLSLFSFLFSPLSLSVLVTTLIFVVVVVSPAVSMN